MSTRDQDHWLEEAEDHPARLGDALAGVPAGEAAAALRVHVQLNEITSDTRPAIAWAAIQARMEASTIEEDREMRAAADEAASALRRSPTAAEKQAAWRPRSNRALWLGWTAAAALVLAAVAAWRVWVVPPAKQLTADGSAQVAETQSEVRYALPVGALARVQHGGAIDLKRNSAGQEQVHQTAGRVVYEFGRVATTVASSAGVVAGQDAQFELNLVGVDRTVATVTVQKGQVLIISMNRDGCALDAGQTAYISDTGVVKIVRAGEPAPVFNIPLPAPSPGVVQTFHPEENAPAQVPPVGVFGAELPPTVPVVPQTPAGIPLATAVVAPVAQAEAASVAAPEATVAHEAPADVPAEQAMAGLLVPSDVEAVATAAAAGLIDTPPDDVPPPDFGANQDGSGRSAATGVQLPSVPTPAGASGAVTGHRTAGSNDGGNGNRSGHGENGGSHFDEGPGGGAGFSGGDGNNASGNGNGNGHGKGH
ncbi:MAG TPA: hypothetical protein VL860_13260 [Planctomycetota bacterium]|nr:hypothetical protein [Planctomycetota bacterium]